MQVQGDGGGKIDFLVFEIGVLELGWIFELFLMVGEFWESVKCQGNLMIFCFGKFVELEICYDVVVFYLSDGVIFFGKLLVGVDGCDLWVCYFVGLVVVNMFYGEKGLVVNFVIEKLYCNIVY